MGFRCSWIAVEGGDMDWVLKERSLERTEESSSFSEPGYNCLEMPGWSILIADGSDYYMELDEAHASALSKGGRALYFMCSDTVMCSQLAEFADGVEVWKLAYAGMNGVSAVDVTGAPPAQAHEAIAKTRATQEKATPDVDHIYDTTAALGKTLTGYRHDNSVEVAGDANPIKVLRSLD